MVGSTVRGGPRPGRLTLTQVAAAAGVSKAAASYAMNGQPGVAEDTRQQVLAAAAELGYRPKRAAADRGTTTIGAVLAPAVDNPETPNYYAAELLAGAEGEARRHDFQLQVQVWDRTSPHLADTGLAGLLYLGGTFPAWLLIRTPMPAVLVGTFFPQWPYDAVLADNSRGAYLATSHLLRRGQSRVGFINGPATTRTSELKLLGYREALAEADLTLDERRIRAADFSIDSGYRAAMDLFEHESPPPDALFVADDQIAIGVMQALADRGLAVPDDVAVIGYGDNPACAAVRPAMSTVRVFQQRMGGLGVRALIDRLGGRLHESVRILVGPEVVSRNSS